MELISADENGATVRFSRQEYADLMGIVHSAGLDYEGLNVEVLNLSHEAVYKIEDDIFEIAAQARFIRKNAK